MYDVIVIGVGSMGSAACYELSKRGLKVLGLEQFDIVHELGSHAGQSRINRKAYFEHPDYVPLLLEAYNVWAEIEKLAGEQLYWETGIAYFAPRDNEIIRGVKQAAALHNIPLESLTPHEVQSRWPLFSIPEEFECLFEPESGFITPEKAIRSMVDLAKRQGAEIKTNVSVSEIRETGAGVEVSTTNETFKVARVIVTAGAYTSQLIDIPAPLKVTRQLLAWTETIPNVHADLGKMPCWMIAENERPGLFYGFPQLSDSFNGPSGLKIAYHKSGDVMDDPKSEEFDSSQENEILTGILDSYLPKAKTRIASFKQCRYTYSPDEHFILDFMPQFSEKVIVVAGFSGHGFKFAPVIAKAIADLTISGQTDLPVDFLRLSRFG